MTRTTGIGLSLALAGMVAMTPGTARAQTATATATGTGAATAASDPHAGHDMHADHAAQTPAAVAAQAAGVSAKKDPKLPADEGGAKTALDSSSRHGEFVDIPVAGGTPLRAFVVYPERKDKAPVVVIVHEIFGLSDWIRGVADQLAAEGFIAVAPDLLSGKGPNGGGTDSLASRDDVVKMIRGLSKDEITAGVNAARAYGTKLPAANGKSATIGFCFGGGVSFSYAAANPTLNAAVVYYGTSPDAAALATLKVPVLGLYGGNDARVTSTVEPAAAEIKKLGGTYVSHIYDGAGHGFLRQQTGADGANMKATEQAWPATIAFLRQHTK